MLHLHSRVQKTNNGKLKKERNGGFGDSHDMGGRHGNVSRHWLPFGSEGKRTCVKHNDMINNNNLKLLESCLSSCIMSV